MAPALVECLPLCSFAVTAALHLKHPGNRKPAMTVPRRITLVCPSCSARLSGSESSIGRTSRCPKCGESIKPDAAEATNAGDKWMEEASSPSEPKFVVRYAADVVSEPMTSSELLEHLLMGRLNADLLFSQVGSVEWKPLTFVASAKAVGKVAHSVAIIEGNYVNGRITIFIGLGICVLTAVEPQAWVYGLFVVSVGVNWILFTWINTFFLNTLALLKSIADRQDG